MLGNASAGGADGSPSVHGGTARRCGSGGVWANKSCLTEEISVVERPELAYDPGELAPCLASPYPDAELTPAEQAALKQLVDDLGNVDVAARRWEVTSAWKLRLMDRGAQYLWPRRGGGWIYVPFATDF